MRACVWVVMAASRLARPERGCGGWIQAQLVSSLRTGRAGMDKPMRVEHLNMCARFSDWMYCMDVQCSSSRIFFATTHADLMLHDVHFDLQLDGAGYLQLHSLLQEHHGLCGWPRTRQHASMPHTAI
jgi:hypothetical protein